MTRNERMEEFRKAFIEAMENAGLGTAVRDEDGEIDVQATLESYSFTSWCSTDSGNWLTLKNVLEWMEESWLSECFMWLC